MTRPFLFDRSVPFMLDEAPAVAKKGRAASSTR